jgi:hypothetical protein
MLQAAGVFLPKSKWDDSMLSGKITPGNGHQLAKILLERNRKTLAEYLSSILIQAQDLKCTKVLLSNEVLIRLFSDQEILMSLEVESKKVGFDSIHLLSYNRNIFEHSLSLYKHRAKYGLHPDYQKWFEGDYETLVIYANFGYNDWWGRVGKFEY